MLINNINMENIHGVEKIRPIFWNRKKTNSFFVLVVDASIKQSLHTNRYVWLSTEEKISSNTNVGMNTC